jgi:hypothetical protein
MLSPPVKKTEEGDMADADFFVLIFESLIAAEFTVSFLSCPFFSQLTVCFDFRKTDKNSFLCN